MTLSGRYHLERFLGEGGTATVHLARDLTTGASVVIKSMKPKVAAEAELRERFVREARALAKIAHPQVVHALDVVVGDDEPPYLVLEALVGETLGQRLEREGALAPGVALDITRGAATALAAVHAAGIVHRDVKPDNLYLVGPIDAPTHVAVLDFGMAHFLEEQSSLDQAESTSILGTAQYMAPEQVLVEEMDARTDVYALGVVLFRMLTGHLPFEARSQKDLLRHQLFSPLPPVSWLLDEVPDGVTTLVSAMTRKAPEHRPLSMEELCSLIDRARRGDALESQAIADEPNGANWGTASADVYDARTERGRHALSLLALEFGVYSRPHHPAPERE